MAGRYCFGPKTSNSGESPITRQTPMDLSLTGVKRILVPQAFQRDQNRHDRRSGWPENHVFLIRVPFYCELGVLLSYAAVGHRLAAAPAAEAAPRPRRSNASGHAPNRGQTAAFLQVFPNRCKDAGSVLPSARFWISFFFFSFSFLKNFLCTYTWPVHSLRATCPCFCHIFN